MTLAKVLSISLCMGVGSLAFATDPPPTPTPPAVAAATAPDTADAASTVAADKAAADKAKSAATTAKTAASSDGVTPEQAKSLRMAGYKTNVRNGVTSYCRNETQIGSRFEKPVCGSAEDVLRRITASQDLVNSMQHTVLAPAPGSGH